MLMRRVVVCLDVDGGRVVKGTKFENLRDVGEPAELACRYEREGADEIVFLDVTATVEQREAMLSVVTRTAERLFVPLTLGGGVRSVDDLSRALRAGADKVALNSALFGDATLLSRSAEQFGRQCVVASIDAKRVGERWAVFTHGGRRPTGVDAVEWAMRCAELGAGEILLTSIDRDGVRGGYDIALTRAVTDVVDVPVVASGGAGAAEHVVEVFERTGAQAALVAGIVHDRETTVTAIKQACADQHISMRLLA
jgi:cyclase